VLDKSGFSSVWSNDYIDKEAFKSEFSQRCHDIFIQNWHENMAKNSQCNNYVIFKSDFKMEKYLLTLDYNLKYFVSKFRTRAHMLPVVKNRFKNSGVEDISCPLCKCGETGDEVHYLLKCSYFNNIRKKYITNESKSLPNHIFLKQIFSGDVDCIRKIAYFIKTILKHFPSINANKRCKFISNGNNG
jgi:hypothetical protein